LPKPSYIAVACGIFTYGTLAVVNFIGTSPIAKPIQKITPPTLQERFLDASQGAMDFNPLPKVVRVIPIVAPPKKVEVEPEPQTPVAESHPLPTPRLVYASRPEKRDVCRVHGMRKVMVGKYKWRCRR